MTALLYFLLLDLYRWTYAPLFDLLGEHPALLLIAKALLAGLILFPPAFLMGGTLPVMGQFLVRRAEDLGRRATLLYALNTLGAAVGSLLAGFYLPAAIGFRNSYWVAIALNGIMAGITFILSRSVSPPPALTAPAGEWGGCQGSFLGNRDDAVEDLDNCPGS